MPLAGQTLIVKSFGDVVILLIPHHSVCWLREDLDFVVQLLRNWELYQNMGELGWLYNVNKRLVNLTSPENATTLMSNWVIQAFLLGQSNLQICWGTASHSCNLPTMVLGVFPNMWLLASNLSINP